MGIDHSYSLHNQIGSIEPSGGLKPVKCSLPIRMWMLLLRTALLSDSVWPTICLMFLLQVCTDNKEIAVSQRSLHSELMCPICLDILKTTMTTKECLHRFCQECIITGLYLGFWASRCHTQPKKKLRTTPILDLICFLTFLHTFYNKRRLWLLFRQDRPTWGEQIDDLFLPFDGIWFPSSDNWML